MSNTRNAIASRNAALNAIGALLNSGYLRIYQGTQPATPETGLGSATLLVELRFGATAFGAASSGSMSALSISPVNASAAGTAQFIRCLQSDGATPVYDGSVDVTGSGADLELSTTSISSGALVTVSALALNQPM